MHNGFSKRTETPSTKARRPADQSGTWFNPILTADGKVALIRRRRFGYGEHFDCSQRKTRNWIALYDPATGLEKVIFDRPLDYGVNMAFCVFEQMQLSHDASVLYLVSPVSATAGSLAIISLARQSVTYVHGVDELWVIADGPHRDELIYQRRIWRKSKDDGLAYPVDAFIHARADGQQIAVISDEYFAVGRNDKVPVLRAYLRKINGTITVNGRKLPLAPIRAHHLRSGTPEQNLG